MLEAEKISEKIKQLDSAIEKSIEKLKNATTGTETKLAILEYEELMLSREKIFLDSILNAGDDEAANRD